MTMKNDVFPLPNIPGYIDVKEAASVLGVAESSVYRYIQAGRLPAYQVGRNILINKETLKQFKPNLTGRPRKRAPLWRASPDMGSLTVTYIQVQIKAGQQENLLKKLAMIRKKGLHLFSGAINRLISLDDSQNATVTIQLVWKSGEIPDEEERQQDFEAFKMELNDVLDWESAQSRTGKAIIHT